jgi:HlyD family secretion protein
MKKISIFLIFISLFLLSAWRINKKNNIVDNPSITKLQEMNGIPVRVKTASRGDLADRIRISGTIAPLKTVKIFAEVGGILVKRNFETGQIVKKGELLAQIDDREFQAQYLMASADLEIARSNLAKAEKGPRDQEVDAAKAGVAQARANFERAKSDYTRYEELYRKKTISATQYTNVKKAFEGAKAMLDGAEAQLSAMKEGTRSEDLAVAKAAMKAAEGRYRLAEINYNKTKVYSPFDGVITERNYEEGDYILPASNPMGKLMCRVLDMKKLYFEGRLNERYLKYIKTGKSIKIIIEAEEIEKMGEISIIDPEGDSVNRDYLIKITIDNQDGKIKPGMFATAVLNVKEAKDAVYLSREYIRNIEGNSGVVYLAQDNVCKKKKISLGIQDGENIEITEGLVMTDKIIYQGFSSLSDGMKIQILEGK